MQTQRVIRYQARPDAADLNEALIREVFAELADRRPADLEYAVTGWTTTRRSSTSSARPTAQMR